jgi:hypothetical protein
MDLAHEELLKLAAAFVAQATPIVREQERLLARLQGNDERRVRLTVLLAGDVIAEQESLIQRLKSKDKLLEAAACTE